MVTARAGMNYDMEYKFICCSDTHGRLPREMSEAGMSAWLHAGDFYDRLRYSPNRPCPRFMDLRKWYKDRTIPVHMVHGNHDCEDPEGIHGECGIDGSLVQVAPRLFVAGLGWHGEAFYDLPTESDMKKVCLDLLRKATIQMRKGDHCVLVTHYPAAIQSVYPCPDGGYEGWLFDCVRDVVENMKPLAVVAGHVHEFFGQGAKWNDTLLVHPGWVPGVLTIDVDAGKASFEFGDYTAG